MVGVFFVGLVYGLIVLLIRQFGIGWLMKIFLFVVVGFVIIVIGLGLVSIVVNMVMYVDLNVSELVYSLKYFSVVGVMLVIMIICVIFL